MNSPTPVPTPPAAAATPAQSLNQELVNLLVNRLAFHNQRIAELQNAAADIATHQAAAAACMQQLTSLGWTPPS